MNNRLSHLFVIRKHMLLSAFGLAIGYIAVAMLGIFTGDLIDSMLNVQAADGVWQKLGLLLLLSLATLCLSFFLTVWIPQKLNLEAAVTSSEVAISEFLKMSLRVFSKNKTGHYLNVVTMAAFVFSGVQIAVSVEFLGGLLAVIVLAIVAFTVNPWIGLLVLLYIPFYLVIIDYPSKKTNEILTESMKKREGWLDIGRRIIEEKFSINVLRAESYFENAYKAANDEYFLYVKRSSFFSALSKNLPSALSNFTQVVAIITGVMLLSIGQMSVGEILAAYLILSVLSEPLDTVCSVKSSYLAAKADIDVYLEHEKGLCPEKWCKQAFQMFKRSAVIS